PSWSFLFLHSGENATRPIPFIADVEQVDTEKAAPLPARPLLVLRKGWLTPPFRDPVSSCPWRRACSWRRDERRRAGRRRRFPTCRPRPLARCPAAHGRRNR